MILYALFSFLFALDVCQSAVLRQNVKNSPASIDPVVSWGLKELFPHSRQRRSVFKTNPKISAIASQTPSYYSTVRLFGKTQVLLQIEADGTVSGTVHCTSKYAKLEIQSMGQGMKRIKGIATGRFVAINQSGALYSTTTPNDEAIFNQELQSTSYNTFASAKYYRTALYDSFISIGKNTVARNAASTNKNQNKVKFLTVTPDSCS